MALTTKLPLLLVFVLLYSFKMISPAECRTRFEWLEDKATASEFHRQQYKQMVAILKTKSKEHSKRGTDDHRDSDKYEDMVEWDLRKVPSGPDPLHHNGGSPKKTRTP